MKRVVMFLAVGVLIFGSALSALAQAPTVSFGGQMRVYGITSDNITDFKDTTATGGSKDSGAFFWQRFRLYTNIESADKKAKAVWALEIGDILWGQGGGASGGEYNACGQAITPGSGTVNPPCANPGGRRVGNGAGGAFGADGVNVETKNLYLWFEMPGLPAANMLLGIHNITFLGSSVGNFLDDDAAGLQFNWKAAPVDLQLWFARLSEGSVVDSRHNDAYAARLGFSLSPTTRFTVEGLLMNEQCLANTTGPGALVAAPGAAAGAPATTAAGANVSTGCVQASLGDTFWIGGTAATEIGPVKIDATLVYGQRQLSCPTCAGLQAEESGYGIQASARVPLGGVNTHIHGWYTTGDKSRSVTPQTSNAVLTGKSDRLPAPETGAMYGAAPLIAEGIFGFGFYGGPAPPSNTSVAYADYSGTFGGGASGIFALTPQFSVGGGVAIVAATESNPNNAFGDHVFEVDAGLIYSLNANLSIRGLAAYLIPDKGDNAWSLGFRTQFSF